VTSLLQFHRAVSLSIGQLSAKLIGTQLDNPKNALLPSLSKFKISILTQTAMEIVLAGGILFLIKIDIISIWLWEVMLGVQQMLELVIAEILVLRQSRFLAMHNSTSFQFGLRLEDCSLQAMFLLLPFAVVGPIGPQSTLALQLFGILLQFRQPQEYPTLALDLAQAMQQMFSVTQLLPEIQFLMFFVVENIGPIQQLVEMVFNLQFHQQMEINVPAVVLILQ